jgi:hypothetical protein
MIQAATLNTGPHHEPASSTAIRLRPPGESTIALDGEPIASPPQRTQGSLAVWRYCACTPLPNGASVWPACDHPIDAHSGGGRPVSD